MTPYSNPPEKIRQGTFPSPLRRVLYLSLSLACLCGFVLHAGARNGPGNKSGTNENQVKSTAAGCLNPEASASLELNNVRALIHSGGDMWWDLQQFGRYEIPKGSGKNSLFLGSLWIGGTDPAGKLKVAAQLFRENGPDFYTGPLEKETADVTAQTCKEFDRLWKITRDEVARFRTCFNTPGCVPEITDAIKNWPAIYFEDNDPSLSGNLPSIQYFYAPFVDVNGDMNYDPNDGDYPGYDLDGDVHCQTNRTPSLYGDETIFWIFNDKGNTHYETQSTAIGLEVRAQAFAFATNDEVNNMTFYNYEIINRGSTTLENCYFAVNTDADLGYAGDDYVGCDVQRGFGYVYNADANDAPPGGTATPTQYGLNPPAIGIDFFEGPYADPDGVANMFDPDVVSTWDAINGVGYDDPIVDNERIGMKRFVYYENNPSSPTGDPTKGVEFYNYLSGRWKNNAEMVFGGNGYPGSVGSTTLKSNFMYPGDSDPYNWGTGGADPGFQWTQKKPCPTCAQAEGADRRFVQAAGPFQLKPGAVNDITTGAVWARASSGDPFASVELVRKADDKAQQLFENCFRLLNGPDAPDVYIQELDRELILYWTNNASGNNKHNDYAEEDYSIPVSLVPDSEAREYKFQGYLVYQVANASVTAEERHDLSKARLVAQCDLRDFDAQGNPIGTLINYTADEQFGFSVPQVEVQGANTGITQSLRVSEDAFAGGADKRLVNHKSYYFMVLAYAYNNYKKYDQNDPTALDGQKKPFLAGRKSAAGSIKVSSAIPHIPAPEAHGTQLHTFYGDGPQLTRVEGNGNGGNVLDLTPESEAALLKPPYFSELVTYRRGSGPVKLKVVDPLSVKKGTYYLSFDGPVQVSGVFSTMKVTSRWELLNEDMEVVAVSDNDLSVNTEQLLFDKETGEFTGLSVVIAQTKQPGEDREVNNGFLEASIEMQDPAQVYLGFIPDNDIVPALNWILSGSQTSNEGGILPDNNQDVSQSFERASIGTGGALAPYIMASPAADAPGWGEQIISAGLKADLLQSIDLVLTADPSKWSRVPVLETAGSPDLAYVHPDLIDDSTARPRKLDLRRSPSVDKNGHYATVDGTINGELLPGASTHPEDANYISEWGMGWFPGYAVSVETGERLNLAFGEDSYLAYANGRDMLFNPTGVNPANLGDMDQVLSAFGDAILGGKHFIYVFGSNLKNTVLFPATPRYDEGVWAMGVLKQADAIFDDADPSVPIVVRSQNSDKIKQALLRSAMWTGIPVSIEGRAWLSGELRVRMRVVKPYMQYSTYAHDAPATVTNDNRPLYRFSTDDLVPTTVDPQTARSALDLINVVPNPYYAYSGYETTQLDNRVKITNLPPECTISIYNVAGSLIRRYIKSTNQITSQDWDLKNFANVPIASGLYIIHVQVPGVGERIIKWFGVLRPTDVSDF